MSAMSATNNTVTPVMEELTTAIVSAAKPKRAPKVPSIVDQIIKDLRSGTYTQEALVNLARIFGREFVAEPVVEKKPRKTKQVTTTDTIIDVITDEAPKPRKTKKATAKTPVEETPLTVTDEAPKPLKTKKATAKTPVEETPLTVTEEAPKPLKTKKATANTPVEETPLTVTEEAPKQEKKPRNTKKATAKTPVEEKPVQDDSDNDSTKAFKEKKPRNTKKTAVVTVTETSPQTPIEERPSTPILEPEDQLPDLSCRLEGFAVELEEEELSDLEDVFDDEEE